MTDGYDYGYVMAPRSLVEDGKRWRAANPKVPATFERDPDDHRRELSAAGQWVHDQLRRYRHKPNVSWLVRPSMSESGRRYQYGGLYAGDVVVEFCMWVLDSRGGERVLPITLRRAVDPDITDMRDDRAADRFQWWLKGALRDIELHEFDEWFRCDGELVHDPHAKAHSQIGPIKP